MPPPGSVDSASPIVRASFGAADSADQQRQALREACLRSTYAFATTVCGFRDLDPVLHGTMSRWIERPSRRKLGLAPRGHLKTSVWTIADSLRLATVDPNTRILLVNEIIGNTVKWLGMMQAIAVQPTYQWLFGDRLPDLADRRVRWNQTQLELRRTEPWPEPTIEGIGAGGASTSNHYERIKEDDLVGKEARESPTVMQKAIDQHVLAESLLVDPLHTIDTVGTRWGVNDLADWMLKHEAEHLDYFHLGIDDELNPLWSRMPQVELRRILQKYGAAWFALQYKNRALAVGATEFDPGQLCWYTTATEPRPDGTGQPCLRLERRDGTLRTVPLASCTVFQLIDAGLSPESDDARSANVVVALTPPPSPTEPFDIVVLHTWAERSAPEATIRRAYEVYQRFQPESAAIEVFGGHIVFWNWMVATFPRMRLRKLPQDSSRSKQSRIRAFYPFVEQGRVYVSRADLELLAEYESFPTGTTVDILDALAWAPTVWYEPRTPTREELWERSRDERSAGLDVDDDTADRTRSPITGY